MSPIPSKIDPINCQYSDAYVKLAQAINAILYQAGGAAEQFYKDASTDKSIGELYKQAVDDLFYKNDTALINAIFEEVCLCVRITYSQGEYIFGNIPIEETSVKDTHETAMQKINAAGHNLVDVPGDGHCFYHAVSHQLSLIGIEKNAAELHADALIHLTENSELYYEFMVGEDQARALKEYIAKHSNTHKKEWAEGVIINALANALGINIHVTHFNADGSFSHESTPAGNVMAHGQTTVHIINIGNMHFLSNITPSISEPVLQQEDSAPSSIETSASDPLAEMVSSEDVGSEAGTIAVSPAGDETTSSPINDTNPSIGPSSIWYQGGWFI